MNITIYVILFPNGINPVLTKSRFLFVRWVMNVTNIYIIIGDKGDTDHEEMIPGSHKTIIMKDVIEKGSESLLRAAGSYHMDDIVPEGSPLIISTSGWLNAEAIISVVKESCMGDRFSNSPPTRMPQFISVSEPPCIPD